MADEKYLLTVAIQGPVLWQFMFNEKRDAERAVSANARGADIMVIADDYGARAEFKTTELVGYKLDELPKVLDLHVEFGLHNTRAQVRAQNRANNDPFLKTARNMMSGVMGNAVINGAMPPFSGRA